jgi:hypothetical protein
VTNSDGVTDTVNASGSVAKGEQDKEIWSAIESKGSAITQATAEGECEPN